MGFAKLSLVAWLASARLASFFSRLIDCALLFSYLLCYQSLMDFAVGPSGFRPFDP